MNFFYIYFYFLLKLSFVLSKSVEFEVFTNQNGVPSLVLALGTPPQQFNFYISTILSKLYIIQKNKEVKNAYDSKSSSTFQCSNYETIRLPYFGFNIKGIEGKDTLTLFSNLKINSFPFMLITEGHPGYYYNGTIGLPYQEKEDKDYSLLYQLSINGLIDYQVFYIKRTGDKLNFIIGEYPLLFKQHYKECQLMKRTKDGELNKKWMCNLHSIFFDNYKMFYIDEPISFSIGGNIFCVSKEFYEYIVMNFFEKAIANNQCEERYERTDKSIYCENSFFLKQTISLILGKWTLKIKMDNFWIITDVHDKLFSLSECKRQNINWSIGYSLLGTNLLVFDKQKDKLGFSIK